MPGIHMPFPLSREEKNLWGKGLKVRAAIRMIAEDGWYPVVTRGSHRQNKHPAKPGRVTISGKMSEDILLRARSTAFSSKPGSKETSECATR